MKNSLHGLLFALAGILAVACHSDTENLFPAFPVKIPAIILTVPPIKTVTRTEVPVGALRTRINMDSTIKAYTGGIFSADDVSTVRVKKMVITALNADTANNLSNFETARMRIYNDTAAVDLATILFPENYSDSLVIIPANSPDISDYLRGRNLSYNLYWKNRKITNRFLKLQIKITLGVQ